MHTHPCDKHSLWDISDRLLGIICHTIHSFVATYDLSVPTSPYGSVHNVEKGPIGERIAAQLMQAFSGKPVWEGPHAIDAKAHSGPFGSSWVNVTFAGTPPFGIFPTKNCVRSHAIPPSLVTPSNFLMVAWVYRRAAAAVNTRLTSTSPPRAGPGLTRQAAPWMRAGSSPLR